LRTCLPAGRLRIPPATISGLRTTGYGLPITDYRLLVTNLPAGRQVTGYELLITDLAMETTYNPGQVEPDIYRRWLEAGVFHAEPGGRGKAYCIVIPPPNVTDKLHVGHALNNTLQDILIRQRRMAGFDTLWMPGTDHAGIATQTVVEKSILADEGKRRTDFQRDEFVARVQAWKDEYGGQII